MERRHGSSISFKRTILPLKTYKEKATDTGEDEPDLPIYEQPKDQIITKTKLNQCIRFNLIRHHGTVADIPTVKLFKSFATTLKTIDPSMNILPFHSDKQHYSSLITLIQIQNMEDNKLGQFFKSYHPKQHYSISGYFRISSTLLFNKIIKKTALEEWLDSHRYFMRQCPSNAEEMVKIGMLCVSIRTYSERSQRSTREP